MPLSRIIHYWATAQNFTVSPKKPIEGDIVPGPHPGHQRNAQQGGQAKDRFGLPMGIGKERVGLQGGQVFEQAIQNGLKLE